MVANDVPKTGMSVASDRSDLVPSLIPSVGPVTVRARPGPASDCKRGVVAVQFIFSGSWCEAAPPVRNLVRTDG